MHNITDKALLCAAVVAVATAWLTHHSLGAAAACAAIATALAARGPAFWPCLAALPTLLASMPQAELQALSPAPGAVAICGTVVARRSDPTTDSTTLELRTRGGLQRLFCNGRLDAMPGDRVRTVARCSMSAILDEPNPVHAAAGACRVDAAPRGLPFAVATLRQRLEDEVTAIAGPEHAGFLCVLTLGRGARVDEDIAAMHRGTGLSHLLAVSGAHAAMLAWLLGLQPFGGGRRRPVSRVHLWLAMGALFVYGAVTGMEPPMFRALCGYLLVAIGLRHGRHANAAQALLWPALASAVLAPCGVRTESFCLSYAAVFGLSLAAPAHAGSQFERFIAAPMRASFWATATTAPLTLAFFGQLAPWTIVLTPLLSPIIAVLLLLCLSGAALGVIGVPCAAALHGPVSAMADLYLTSLGVADQLPGTPVHAFGTPSPMLLLAAAAGAVCILANGMERRRVLASVCVLCVPHFLPQPYEPVRAELFAIGHGQACLLALDDGRTVLVDCGSQQRPSLPSRKVEAALRRRRIDLLVLTHSDHDHTGGVSRLLRSIPVRQAALPESMRGSPTHTELMREGVALRWLAPGDSYGDASTLLVQAPALFGVGDNDASLWVRAQIDGARLLLTGDAEEAGVAYALQHGLASKADVLVLPHHGRPNAAILRLLQAVEPSFCLVSNERGDGNSEQGAVAMAFGIPVFATGSAGDLRVEGGAAPRIRAAALVADPQRAQ
jgi:competence protein ComEC